MSQHVCLYRTAINFKPSYELYNLDTKIFIENEKNKDTNKDTNKNIKKQKITTESFDIPTIDTIHLFDEYNYSIQQIKVILKHYNLKLSGKKEIAIKRIIYYLNSPKWIIKMQKCARGYIQRRYNRLHGPAYLKRSLCTNASDFYTLDPVGEIPFHQFISYKDKDGFIYGFDIASLFHLFSSNSFHDVENPYNRNEITKDVFATLCEIIQKAKLLKAPLTISIDNQIENISEEKSVELRALELFQQINQLGNYSSSEWFLDLSIPRLTRYLRELIDIWNYRAQISNQVKRQICSPHGNPFAGLNLIELSIENDIIKIQEKVLKVMENMVYNGINNDSKSLGALYILGGLTIVNSDAGRALPWLYQSFI